MVAALMFVWGLLAGSLLVVLFLPWLLLSELWQRIFYQRPWYLPRASLLERLLARLRPSAREDYETNRWGLRDREFPADPAPGTIRILVLGDSFTDGNGVEAEETHPKVMERMLNARAPAGTRFEVVNAGWGGSYTSHWVDTLRHLLGEFRPQLVLAVFYMRDATDIGSVPEFFGRIRDNFLRSAGIGYRISYLYRRSVDAMYLSVLSRRFVADYNRYYFGPESATVEWRMAQENLEQMAALSAEAGAGFALANFPTLFQLDETHPFRAIYEAIEAFAERRGIPYVDLFPAFEGRAAHELWVSVRNQHPNGLAHRIAGELLADAIDLAPSERATAAGS